MRSFKAAFVFFIFSLIAASKSFGLDIAEWWDDLGYFQDLQAYARVGGWRFWYENDKDYVYSDAVDSWFQKEPHRFSAYPMGGGGARFSFLKIGVFNALISSHRISAGIGVGLPIGSYDFHITPWITAEISRMNAEACFTLEGGADIFYKWVVFGLSCAYSTNDKAYKNNAWLCIDYGISVGLRIYPLKPWEL